MLQGITGEVEAAEEIVEELSTYFWKDREHLQIFQSIKSYLYRATRNEALQYCQHREVREAVSGYVLADNVSEQVSDPHRQLGMRSCRRLSGIHLIHCQGRRLEDI